MPVTSPIFLYRAPSGPICLVQAPSKSKAAKMLLTTPRTIDRNSEVFQSIEEVPTDFREGALLAASNEMTAYISVDGMSWRELSESDQGLLLSPMQMRVKTVKSSTAGDAAMKIRALRTSDETWERYLKIGGISWFRQAVDAEFEKTQSSQHKILRDKKKP